MRKEIYMGHGLYKQVEVIETIEGDVEWRIVELEGGGFIRRPFPVKTESLKMQDELEPIIHPTQRDESDDLEAAKSEEMTEFEKAEYKRKIEEVRIRREWNESAEKNFWKGEKWEYKNED